MSISDAALVSRALSGSQEAYRSLVQRFERPIFGLILRMVHDFEVAEDLAQETFVKAFRHLDRYDPERKLASWLFKIAHNTAIDHLRRKRPVEIAIGPSDPDDEPSVELRASESEAPDLVATRSALADAIEAAFGEMKPGYREILLLRFQEGLAYQEIAEVTDQPVGTVKVQLHRARKQLAGILAGAGWSTAKAKAKPDSPSTRSVNTRDEEAR